MGCAPRFFPVSCPTMDVTTLLLLGIVLLALVQMGISLALRRTPTTPPFPPQEVTPLTEDVVDLRTRFAALERQVQDLEQTVEARHRKVTGMIAGERAHRSEEPASEEAVSEQIMANLSGDRQPAATNAGSKPTLRKRR